MRTIFRFEIPIDGEWHEYEMKGKFLHVAQRRSVEKSRCIEFWIEWDREAEPEQRLFCVIGTGGVVPQGGMYCGTAISPNGDYVWHLYSFGEVA